MNINLKNLQRKKKINLPKIKTIILKILKSKKIDSAHLSIVFVGQTRMRSINRDYLGHDYVTDVITFNLSESKSSLDGEIFICPLIAERNAKEFGHTFHQEICLYVIHGILHLLGYDDHNKEDIKRMRKEEQRLMKLISK